MKYLVLGNIDYRQHVTDEGEQMQAGFVAAGWEIAGHGYGDGCKHVGRLLDRHRPDIVFVQDKRDWSPDSPGCYDPAVEFEGIEELAKHKNLFVITMVKDAGSATEYQREFCESIEADAILHHYHEKAILPLSPWLDQFKLVRTYHTLDADLCTRIPLEGRHRRCIVTGAVSTVYPLRRIAFRSAEAWGIDTMQHPGYNNRGCHVADYLATLSCYRVHIATASKFGFALRKIIESVAMGATALTNLPRFDVLPEIDEALVRLDPEATVNEIASTITLTNVQWDFERAKKFAVLAREWYDYRAVYKRVSDQLIKLALEKSNENSRTDGERGLCGSAGPIPVTLA